MALVEKMNSPVVTIVAIVHNMTEHARLAITFDLAQFYSSIWSRL